MFAFIQYVLFIPLYLFSSSIFSPLSFSFLQFVLFCHNVSFLHCIFCFSPLSFWGEYVLFYYYISFFLCFVFSFVFCFLRACFPTTFSSFPVCLMRMPTCCTLSWSVATWTCKPSSASRNRRCGFSGCISDRTGSRCSMRSRFFTDKVRGHHNRSGVTLIACLIHISLLLLFLNLLAICFLIYFDLLFYISYYCYYYYYFLLLYNLLFHFYYLFVIFYQYCIR